MSSKSTSQRNERILTELRGREGNDTCADCGTRQPRWASWTLGIWLCVRCATIHRRMGTHISRVKSASLDIWTKEQVESMRDMGNIKSNMLYNPNPKLHPPPLDLESEHAESQLERYIFQKYRDKAFMEKPKKKSSSSRSNLDSNSTSSSSAPDSRLNGPAPSPSVVATKSEGGTRYKSDGHPSNGVRTPAVSITTPPDPTERAFSPPAMPLASQQPASHLSPTAAGSNVRAMTAPLPDQSSRSFSPAIASNQGYNPSHRQMTASAQIPSMTGMPLPGTGMASTAGYTSYQQSQPPILNSSYLQSSTSSPYGHMAMYKPAIMPQSQDSTLKGEVWQDLAGLSLSGNGMSAPPPLSSSFTGYQSTSMPMMPSNPFLQSSMMSAKAPSQLSSMSSGSSFSSLGSASSAGFSPNYTQTSQQSSHIPSYQFQATQPSSAPLAGNPYMNVMQHQQQQSVMPTMPMQQTQQFTQMNSQQQLQQQQPYQFHPSNPFASQVTQLHPPYPQYVQNQFQMS